MKRISSEAYQAFRDALASVTWYKRDFKTLVHALLRDHPELVAGLNFDDPKRSVADELVSRLIADEARYRDVTLSVMLELAGRTSFADIERLTEPDRSLRLDEAKSSVARLAAITEQFSDWMREKERLEAERVAQRARSEQLRRFDADIANLKATFLTMQTAADPRQRGYDFEALLNNLFRLFDMEPRLGYKTATEQIDGSMTFNTDDYVLEAKWTAEPVDRATADAFDSKVRRKGKNALGLFVAINGFSADARKTYNERTSFVTMDGSDLFLVLDGRIRLDDLLHAKRRHANETGSCYLSANSLLSA